MMKCGLKISTVFVFYMIVISYIAWTLVFFKDIVPNIKSPAYKLHSVRLGNVVSLEKAYGFTKVYDTDGADRHILPVSNLTKWRWMPTNDSYLIQLSQGGEFCGGKFIGYEQKFAILHDVIVEPMQASGKPGGENISDVLNQPEKSEYHKLRNGYFSLNCSEMFQYAFHPKTHVQKWFETLNLGKHTQNVTRYQPVVKWTIAVQRYEYVNLYHTMTDWYNTFLLAKLFHIEPGKMLILWIDGHPQGGLDDTWKILFGDILRSGSIGFPIQFKHMVWGIMGYDSSLNKHDLEKVHYLEEFREFFLLRYGITDTTKRLNCDNLKVLFIWRHDYVAHPRNPSGRVSRKIKNENELLKAARSVLQGHTINGIQIDELTMVNQLKLISQTDILIGMHGAGLTHTLFLPEHAGLIEFYPTYWSPSNTHFASMARWRGLHYSRWVNIDRLRELPDYQTIVDTDKFKQLLTEMKHAMCL